MVDTLPLLRLRLSPLSCSILIESSLRSCRGETLALPFVVAGPWGLNEFTGDRALGRGGLPLKDGPSKPAIGGMILMAKHISHTCRLGLFLGDRQQKENEWFIIFKRVSKYYNVDQRVRSCDSVTYK